MSPVNNFDLPEIIYYIINETFRPLIHNHVPAYMQRHDRPSFGLSL